MKRIQINARSSETDVLLKLPTVDANKEYLLTVEKTIVPALDSLILNVPLLSIERRVVLGTPLQAAAGHEILPLPAEHLQFTPQNVRTVSQFVYQLNLFFREFLLRINTVVLPATPAHQYGIPLQFLPHVGDWYNGLHVLPIGGIVRTELIQNIQAVVQPDGRIGFKFSPNALSLFVLKLTEEGQRIFAHTDNYIAMDNNGQFELSAYAPAGVVLFDLPNPMVAEPRLFFTTNSLFSHVNYRHELVFETSLPVNNTVECDGETSHVKHQLVSYKFPSSRLKLKYRDILYRNLEEESQTMYSFDQSIRTHNSFLLKGSELQNFHIRLISRNYVWDGSKYNQTNPLFPLHNDTFYTIQLAIRPLK